MSVRRKLGPGLILFAALGTLLALPGTASAAPAPNAPVPNANAPVPAAPNAAPAYPPTPPTVSVSTTTPAVGGPLGISFTGFRGLERISVDVVPGFRHLGAFRSNLAGNGFGSVRIPGGLRGTQILLLTGLGSGRVATAVINVLGPGAAQGGTAGGPISGGNTSGGASGGSGGSSSNAGRAGGTGSGGISGSQSAGGSAGLASTGFSAFEYARIAGGLILAGGALALIGRKARRRSRGKAQAA